MHRRRQRGKEPLKEKSPDTDSVARPLPHLPVAPKGAGGRPRPGALPWPGPWKAARGWRGWLPGPIPLFSAAAASPQCLSRSLSIRMLERESGGRWCGRGDVKPSPKQPWRALAPLTPPRSPLPRLPGHTRDGDTRNSPGAPRCSGQDHRDGSLRMLPELRINGPSKGARGSAHPRSCASGNSPSINRQLPTTGGKVGREAGGEGEIVRKKKFISLSSLAGPQPAAAEDGTAASRGWKRRCRTRPEGQGSGWVSERASHPTASTLALHGSRLWGAAPPILGGNCSFRAALARSVSPIGTTESQ